MHPFAWFLLLSLVIPSLPAGEKEPLPLLTFVLAGQSNMVGKRCLAPELPEALRTPDPDVLFFDAATNGWRPLQPGVSEPKGFGPEIAFGAAMKRLTGRPIGIIKHSVGGTNLAVQWNPAKPGPLFRQLLEKVSRASKSRDLEIAGMLWVQGGADAKREDMANAYAANLAELIRTSRARFGNPDLVFLSGRIPPKNARKKPFWETVRLAQQNLADDNYAWIDCDAIPVGRDGIHFNTAGMVMLGEAQAALMAERLKK